MKLLPIKSFNAIGVVFNSLIFCSIVWIVLFGVIPSKQPFISHKLSKIPVLERQIILLDSLNVVYQQDNQEKALEIDSITLKLKNDSIMYYGQIKAIQSVVLQQKSNIKQKDALIDEMSKGLKCKNFWGKVVDCK